MDRCNCFAVSLLLEHNVYARNGKEFFDMHGLQVAEVASCLDMLLDGRVSQLREVVERSQAWQYLYLITGQGKHSRYGVPQIKNATVDHLTKRGLCFRSDDRNDGCLIVWIDKDMALSSELR
ncbi:uncharacterized protein LOC119085536 [Bradysia coprophila]|uniref:uncharacterized protein LOC119085536 n=1 Tax=Bradysia coprophila TaxID=38358 RepID=UPI00187D7259|nr:uncharacterized protein LOC119085536 [Bradysia coprophila]